MSDQESDVDLQQLWQEVNQLLREGEVNRPLWDAAATAQPLVLDGDTLVLGLTPQNMRHASYLETDINRAQVREILQARTGRNLDITVIAGSEAADWERTKERRRAEEDRAAGAVRRRADYRGAEAAWEKANEQLSEIFSGTRARAYPTVKARLLSKAFPAILQAEQTASQEEPEAQEAHQRYLNRLLERVATYTDIPVTVVALEYLRYAASHKHA